MPKLCFERVNGFYFQPFWPFLKHVNKENCKTMFVMSNTVQLVLSDKCKIITFRTNKPKRLDLFVGISSDDDCAISRLLIKSS